MPQVYQQQTSPTGGSAALQQLSTPQVANLSTAQAESNVGSQLSNTAAGFMDIHVASLKQQQQQKDEQAALWSANVMSGARLNQTKILQNMQNSASTENNGAGFTDNFLKQFDKYQQEQTAKAPDLSSKKFLTEQMLSLRDHLGQQALDYQSKQNIVYNVAQFKQQIENSASTVALDPTQASSLYGTLSASIDKQQLPISTKFELKEYARKSLVDANVSNQLMNNAAGFRNSLAPSVGQLPEGTPQAKIADAAKANGNNPLVSLAIAKVESDFNPYAKNAESSATGMYQFLDSTWAQYGGTAADRNNVDKQIEIAQKFQTDNLNYLRTHLGREPTSSEQYLAHFLGATGASATISANQTDPSTKMADVIRRYAPKDADKIIAANHFGNKSVGQVISLYGNKMNDAVQGFISSEKKAQSPFIQNIMTQQERDHAISMADSIMGQNAQALKVNLNGQIQDHEAQAMNGILPATPLTQQQFNAMYPGNPEQAQQEYQKYDNTLQTGMKINQMSMLTPESRAAMIQAATPIPNTSGYADNLKLQEQLIRANAAINEQLTKDPVGFINQKSPLVKQRTQLLLSANTPENRDALYDAQIASQKQLGIEYPQLLDKTQENSIIEKLSHVTGIQKVGLLTDLSQQYGSKWGMVSTQLANSKAAPDGLSAILAAPNPYYAQQAAFVSGQNEKVLASNLPQGSKGDIDTTIQSLAESYIQSIGLAQQGSPQVQDLLNNIHKQVYAQVAAGANYKKASKDVVNAFLGNMKYNYLDQNSSNGGAVTMRIPANYNANIVEGNAKNITKSLTINDIDLANTEPLNNPYDLTNDASGFVGMIKDNAVWQTSADDQSVTLYFIGQNNMLEKVYGKDGKPITKTFSELNRNTVPPHNIKSAINNPALPITLQGT